MRLDIAALLPSDKLETDKAEAIIAQGFPAVEPVLPALLEWMQDINWPVAQTLLPFLASIGGPLAPHVRHVLETKDEIWKYWVIHCLVCESIELARALKPELQRLALEPTPGEREEELDVVAKEILLRI
ncbi:DUF5071 domain-containing protein [Azovibrio restrictus]|uniref:DUF5071 domain-containing protein n=1 Tax=Azovibrio restrictus TaxID=146938 RepID=UPI0026EACB41|nr:DUF5071 domain-containing protein [Azovibrio restrictus]MDD3484911.1 DUF5071 domain-containing protein [Azovibrio restrictus]